MELKDNDTIASVLSSIRNEKKDCEILVRSGKRYSGKILSLNDSCVVLQLYGERSFYDAIIRIDDISTIEIQTRNT